MRDSKIHFSPQRAIVPSWSPRPKLWTPVLHHWFMISVESGFNSS